MRADPVTEREVLAVLERYGEALRNNDPKALIGVFTGDEDTMLMGAISGEFAVGASQVEEMFRRVFVEPQHMSMTWDRVEVFCSGEVAWFAADGALVAWDTRIAYRLSGVLERRDGQWKLAQFHGSVPP
ncbi:MAG: nuclear transport factor 2 family protein [Candidatus Korobacteraceae bacterium]|jgi:uncharacterized protein (TIGR02246 family)